nr:Major facilitator superfamily MFS-1 domain containing protein [Haemonchus contortus]
MDDVRSEYYQKTANTSDATPHWLESSARINSLFSAIAIGCLIGTIPGPFLIHRIGVWGTMTTYGALSTFATMAFPFAVRTGFVAVFIMRVLQGIGTSLSSPITGLVASQWSTTKSAGTFVAILSCHIQFCSIFTMPVAGALCETSLGWPSVFYLQGAMSVCTFLAFFLLYRDDPRVHRNVSSTEVAKIIKGKQGQEKGVAPYRLFDSFFIFPPFLWAIATDPCILAIWISNLGNFVGFQIFLLYGPTYINKVLHYNVRSTGFTTALPYILSAMGKFIVGPISDRATCVSDKWRLVLFATSSYGVMGLSFLSLVFVKTPALAQTAYTLAIVASGWNAVGTLKGAQMVARQHVHIVMAVTSFLLCVTVLLIPVAVNAVCPDNTPEQWSRLFFGISVIVIASVIPFVFLARSDPAPWTGNKIHAPLEKINIERREEMRSDCMQQC